MVDSDDMLSVVVERDMPFPAAQIWQALTQPHLIEEWLMKTHFKPEVGQAFTLTGDWGGLECEVLNLDPQRSLSYTWNYRHDDPAYALNSTVTFTLTATEAGTRVRMEQVGFRPDQKQAFHGARVGWVQHLANLESSVARLD